MRLLRTAACLLMMASPLLAQPKDPTSEVFKPGAVHVFKIDVAPDELKKLKADPRKYCKCTITIGDVKLEEAAIHLKGAAGSARGWDDKPALTINLDKFKSGQSFKGLDKFHLNNSVQDGTYMNEIMYSEIALKMGIPTARSAHAIVELNGRKVGLYVLKEGYDSNFVKRNFPKATGGNLYDGGFLMDIDNKDLKLNDGPGGNNKKDLQVIVKACQIQDPKKRFEEMSKVVDVDLFCADAAMQIIFTDWDGYNRNRNNYRLYCPPNGGKAVFIPHGKDQLLQNPHDALWHGWGGLAARAILDTPEGKKLTIAKMKEIQEKHFDLDKIYARLDEWIKPTKEALNTNVKKDAGNFLDGEIKALKDRYKQRAEYMKKELPKLK